MKNGNGAPSLDKLPGRFHMQDTPATSCFEFVDNTLHIRIPRAEIRICWSAYPRAEEKSFRGAWKQYSPTFRILRPLSDQKKSPFELDVEGDNKATQYQEQKQQVFNAFRSIIPAELVAIVERFGSHQWSLLKLLHAEQAAVDMARSNPVLV